MSTEASLKRTPLFDAHQRLGAKIVPFAGWEMPVQYSGVIPEHRAVREQVGLFDVSHMGEIFVEGKEAELAISSMTCNDLRTLSDGKAQYSAIINPDGGVVDDIIIYRFSATRYLICVNASNADKDQAWFVKHNRFDAEFVNRSAEYGQIAIQGPKAAQLLSKLPGLEKVDLLSYFHFGEYQSGGVPLIVARTGYTGEDGFEVFVPAAATEQLWETLLKSGGDIPVLPIGLGARDTLRLEACYPLHGHELGDDISAIESGLGWIVKPAKGEFIGRDVLVRHREQGAPRALVGFFVEDAGIARHGAPIVDDSGAAIGVVTSGTKTPTVDRALGMALVPRAHAAEGTVLKVAVRGRQLQAKVVKRPFYKRSV